MNPLLSICIPTYNNCAELCQSLEVIKEQVSKYGLKDSVEVIISDNCSTDDTCVRVKRFIEDAHGVVDIRYFCNDENIGGENNICTVLGYARGKYAHTLGSDDYYTPDGLWRLIHICRANVDYRWIALSNNYYWVIDGEVKVVEKRDHVSTECLSGGDFLIKEDLRCLSLSNNVMLTDTAKMCLISNMKGRGLDWPHLAIMAKVMSSESMGYVVSYDEPIVTIRWGNHEWGRRGIGPYLINAIKCYLGSEPLSDPRLRRLELEKFRKKIFDNSATVLKCDGLANNLRLARNIISIFSYELGWALRYSAFLILEPRVEVLQLKTEAHDYILSICIPASDVSSELASDIERFLKEVTDKRFEVVVYGNDTVDDAITELLALKDSRFKVVRNKSNAGVMVSLAEGLLLGSGKYAMLLTERELLQADEISKVLDRMRSLDVSAGRLIPNLKIETGLEYDIYPTRRDILKNEFLKFAQPSGYFYRTGLIKKYNILERLPALGATVRTYVAYYLVLLLSRYGSFATISAPLDKSNSVPMQPLDANDLQAFAAYVRLMRRDKVVLRIRHRVLKEIISMLMASRGGDLPSKSVSDFVRRILTMRGIGWFDSVMVKFLALKSLFRECMCGQSPEEVW